MYIDSVFLLNLIINYLLLLVAARIAGVGPRRLRVLGGAAVGGLYAAAVWLPGLEFLSSLWGKAAASVLMVLAAYAGYARKRLGRLLALFAAAALALGGGVLAVELLVYGRPSPGGVPVLPVDFKTLLLTAAVSYALLTLAFRRAARHGPKELLRVRVRHAGRETELTALLDSGHSLYDPISGSAVLVVDPGAARRILGVPVPERLARDPVGALSESVSRPAGKRLAEGGLPARFRLIPYRTVGAEGFLAAFRPEAVWFGRRRQGSMLIALSPRPVSDGAGYEALANSE
ncbi:MAG: sigma-E processing peptidase SpoIIGA [Oscillospiraceae bacterium]|nr:sigma-E processing peptidase SpoIIGA [Oscillospiraceae bacterium]